MKFRTEIEVEKWQQPLEYSDQIVCLGSCFANNIAERMRAHKFNAISSPTGILFNPASIAQAVEMMAKSYEGDRVVDHAMMIPHDGRYLNYDFHSSISGESIEHVAEVMHDVLVEGGRYVKGCDLAIITLGTAWCYIHKQSGRVVANCHKQPSNLFERRLMSVAEVVESLVNVVENVGGRVLFTVSPIRHVGEGLEDNSLSKAILRVAVSEVCNMYGSGVGYFPSYEMMMDDLRDYRFYDADMVHPTRQAVDYITEKFFDAALSERAKHTMHQVDRVISAVQHRPFNPHGESYKAFCRKQIEAIDGLKGVDLSKERAFFERILAEND